MNKVVLVGRLTKDPELRFTPGNSAAVCNITLAVDRFNTKTGEKEADFIPVVIWGKQAEATANYLLKGRQAAVSGRIQTRSYDDKDGIKRYVTEVVADMLNGIQFLGNSNQNDNNNRYSSDNMPQNDVSSGYNNEDITPVDDRDMPF